MEDDIIEIDPKKETISQKKKAVFAGLIIAAVVGITGLVAYTAGTWRGYNSAKNAPVTPPTIPVEAPEPAVVPATDTTGSTIDKVTDAGVSWVEPKKLEDLKLVKKSDSTGVGDAEYYKIADLDGGGSLIYAKISRELGFSIVRFRKDASNNYFYLKNHSTFTNIDQVLADGVKIDSTTRYKTLTYPTVLDYKTISLKQTVGGLTEGNVLFKDLNRLDGDASIIITKDGETNLGDMYKSSRQVKTETDDGSVVSSLYYLKLADSSVAPYRLNKEFMNDNGSITADWTSQGEAYKSREFNNGFSGASGCGRGIQDQIYTKSDVADRLVTIGTTKAGDSLYAPKSTTDTLYKIAYETYKVGREDDKNRLSLDSFIAKKPLIVWKDKLGDYLPLMDKNYDELAECGKPVIYLYPEAKTNVSVKVDAKITKSEPAYNAGWKVLAYPDGKLINQDGKTYDSLFWEGKGHDYPMITEGRVVETKNIEQELRHDLSQLGLTAKESQDFLNFWLPKMPTQPYTRLTWFGTNQMNVLAPLTVTPKPDTMIRVFLDFEGQNSTSTNLKPQKLGAITRKGFTVVEWGGLLK